MFIKIIIIMNVFIDIFKHMLSSFIIEYLSCINLKTFIYALQKSKHKVRNIYKINYFLLNKKSIIKIHDY